MVTAKAGKRFRSRSDAPPGPPKLNTEACKSATSEDMTSQSRGVECTVAASGSNVENFSPNAAYCVKTKPDSTGDELQSLDTSKGNSLSFQNVALPLVATVTGKTISVKIKMSGMKASETIISQGKTTPRRKHWSKTPRRSATKFVTPSASVSNKSKECDLDAMMAILPSHDMVQPQKKKKKRGRPRKDSKPNLEDGFKEAVAQTTSLCSVPCHMPHGSNMVRPSPKDETVQSSTVKSSSTAAKFSHNATALSSVEHPVSFELVPYDIIFSNADNEYDALWLSRSDEFFAAPKADDDSKAIAPLTNCHTPVQTKRLSFMPVHNMEAQTNYFSPNPSSLLSADDIGLLSDQQVNATEIDYETPLKEQTDTSLIEFSWKSSTSCMFQSGQDLPRLDVDEFVSRI